MYSLYLKPKQGCDEIMAGHGRKNIQCKCKSIKADSSVNVLL